MKELTKRLENLLAIDDKDTNESVIFKLRLYEWLIGLCDILEKDSNKKDIN